MSFDLQEALNGAPVKLRNGRKAFVKYNLLNEVEKLEVRDTVYPLIGYRFDGIYINTTSWSLTGKSVHWRTIEYDIIGMWEEPELTSEQVLEKAFNEDLFVTQSTSVNVKLKVIAKSKDGVFVLEADNGFMSKSCDGEYVLYKDLEPKSDTITVTLPKPFKPKQGETYYSITPDGEGVDTLHAIRLDHGSILNGNCFRSKADAQAWQDAMKNALDD